MRTKGSILIFTLWVLIILAVLSVVLSHRASTDVRLAKYESDSIKATYLARAGVMKMLAELASDKNGYDSLNEDWNRTKDNPKELKLAGGTVYYGASDESGRLNLNTLQRTQLSRLCEGNETLVDEILNYKTENNKDFEFMEELFLASEDMTRELYSQLKDLVTVYREAEPKVNVNTASREVLEVVLESKLDSVSLVEAILRHREGDDGIEGTDDDGFFDSDTKIDEIGGLEGFVDFDTFFIFDSNYFRIWAEASFSDDREIVKKVEAVVNRTSGKIHHWKEY